MRTQPPRKPPPPTPKSLALNFVLSVGIEAFFPWLDWTKRYGPRGWAIHIAAHAALFMGMEQLMHSAQQSTQRREELKVELLKELGRPPWPEEIDRAWMKEHGIEVSDPNWRLR
jgi:hypothetical protein